jgi:diguanylate cyclase (GGDEF)-like protein
VTYGFPSRLKTGRRFVGGGMTGLLTLLTTMTQSTVAGGYVVALTLVVMLQYLHYVTRQLRTKKLADQFRRDVDGLSLEVLQLNRERNLHRLENQILREVLGHTECARAINHLLKRFITTPEDAFAIVLPLDPAGDMPPAHRGLSDESIRQLRCDVDLVAQLQEHGAVVWESPTTHNCPLFGLLSHADRKKARHLFAIAVGDERDLLGVLIATSLLPIAAPRSDQIELTKRIMSSIAPNLRQTLELERQSAQLRCTQEMLELRAITDSKFDQPMKMIERFLMRLSQMIDADRMAVYLPPAEEFDPPRLMLAAGVELQAGLSARWSAHEQRLAEAGRGQNQVVTYDATQLNRLKVDTLIASAATVPLEQSGQNLGLLCITRRSPGPFAKSNRQLLAWSGETLAHTLQRVRSYIAIERQAKQDGLTQLANRRTFDDHIQRELDQLRNGTLLECSLLLLDLDRFKSINDRYGHLAGDEVLREAARVMRDQVACIRASDRALLARYGGEEMAILLPGVGINGALRVAENIRAAIEAHAITFNGTPIPVTISAGVATAPLHARSAQQLISAADAALYQAKSDGRNQVQCPMDDSE